MSRFISFAVLLAFIVLIGLLFYKVMIGFVVPIFLAAVLVVVFRPLHRWVLKQCSNRERFAAAVTTTLILLIVLVPLALLLTTAAIQATQLVNNFNDTQVIVAFAKIRKNLDLEMEFPGNIRAIQEEIDALDNEMLNWNSTTRFQDLADTQGQFAGLVRKTQEEVNELRVLAIPQVEPLVEGMTDTAENSGSIVVDPLVTQFDALSDAIDDLINPLSSTNSLEDQPNTIADEEVADEPVNLLELKARVLNLNEQWSKTRTLLLGGSTRAFFKQMANPSDERLGELRNSAFEYLQPKLLSLTSATGAVIMQLFFGVCIMLVALYFFLYDGPSMVKTFMRLSPLDDRYEQELLDEFDRTSRAVVLATILSALVQGVVAGIGYYFAGIDSLVFLTFLTAVCALIPFFGPAIVWVPVCLWLGLYEENWLAAGLLALWGTLIVGSSDNLVKAFVLHGQSSLHPLLALLSVLGGVQSLGPIGIVVGPMAVTMLQTLLGILQSEMAHFDEEQSAEGITPDGSISGSPSSGGTVGSQIFAAWKSRAASEHESKKAELRPVESSETTDSEEPAKD